MEATGNEHILMDRRYLVKAARCVLHHYHVMVKRLFSFNKSTSVNLYSVTSTRSIVDPTDGQCPGCILKVVGPCASQKMRNTCHEVTSQGIVHWLQTEHCAVSST